MGADYPPVCLKFVRVFSHDGISTLVGHRVFDPSMLLHVDHVPWCILHRLPADQEQRALADVQRMRTMPPPSRHMTQVQMMDELSML